MIYTVTLNPAVDYVADCGKIELGAVNRLSGGEIFFGGKGINVSLVLRELDIPSKALGFIAGFTGEAIEKGITEKGIDTGFVHLESGFSRINIKLRCGLPTETELNGQGPHISQEKTEELFSRFDKLKEGDTLVLAGSIPASLSADIYEKILAYLQEKNIRAVVDASGNLLMNVLKYRPFLVKPNNIELGEIFGCIIDTPEKAAEYAFKIKEMGAVNVLVSMAEQGAVLVDESGKVHISKAYSGTVKNTVGAGDSMVAGFIAGYEKGGYEYALKLGTACGGATAFSEGLATAADIYALLGEN
ncbi:MAG: 1-phosphofructokinase [Ruminococcus sp.]|nr:1-phosphofructokinase [Ruminococcus sp.]